MTAAYEQSVEVVDVPDTDKTRMRCPECGHLLPIDSWTECDRCGAHLSVHIRVEVEGIDDE